MEVLLVLGVEQLSMKRNKGQGSWFQGFLN